MALKDCIKKLGVVSKPDQEKLQRFLEEGLTDEQAVRRLLIETNVDVIDIAARAREAGAVVQERGDVIADIRSFQDERLQRLMMERAGIEDQIAESNAEYGDMAQNLEMFNDHLRTKLGWGKDFEEMSDSELRMAIGQLLFNPAVRSGLARGVLGIQGNSTKEVFESLENYREQMRVNRRAHGGLINKYNKVASQIDQIVGSEMQTFFQEPGRTTLGFYSALEKAALDMNLPEWKADKPASGKAIIQKLRKMPGVKKEEIEWSGIEDLLTQVYDDGKPTKWTREEVAELIRDNVVNVEETVTDPDKLQQAEDLDWSSEQVWDDPEAWEHFADDMKYDFDNANLETDELIHFDAEDWLGENLDKIYDNYEPSMDAETLAELDEVMGNEEISGVVNFLNDKGYDVYEDMRAEMKDDADEAADRYAEESYYENPLYIWTAETREADIFIFGNDDQGYQVSEGGIGNQGTVVSDGEIWSLNEAMLQAESHARDEGYLADEDDIYAPRWGDYVAGDYQNYREVKLKLPDSASDFYETAHFGDEENIVMFLRVTDRRKPSGPMFNKPISVPGGVDPAQYNLKQLTAEEARKANEAGQLVIYGTPADSGVYLNPMRIDLGDNVRNAFFRDDRHTFYVPKNLGRLKQTYFIDEAQSDWHQQGREYGYEDSRRNVELNQEINRIEGERSRLSKQMLAESGVEPNQLYEGREITIIDRILQGHPAKESLRAEIRPFGEYIESIWENPTPAFQEYTDLSNQLDALKQEQRGRMRAVPDAPFKEDAWLSLGLKRALMQAVEEGNDQFAWVDAQAVEDRWGSRFREMYDMQYDKKMPSIIRKLTGQKPVHLNVAGGLHRPGETGYWVIELTDELKDKIQTEGFPLFQDKRGEITFDEARKATINLYEAADFSTFIHEAGHLYLELMGMLADRMDASEQILKDWETVKKYLGVAERGEIKREHHEKWARSFEKYAMDGKAPAIALQDAFNAFRRWLGEIYKRIRGVRDIELPDDIRQVMDRMLATDVEIQMAEDRQEMGPIFGTADEMGVSPEVFEVYRRSISRAHDDAVQAETVKMLEAMKRDELEWYRNEQQKVEDKVRQDVYQMRVYRAIARLTKGKQPDGSPLEQGSAFKLDRKSLLDLFQGDTEILKMLPHSGAYGIYRREGGVDVDVAAQRLGFTDGRDLIEAILKAPPMEDVIKAETSRRMDQIYPDPFKSGELAEDAVRAVHNDRRAQVLAAEMRQLRKLQRRDKPIVRATEQAAKREEREDREIAKDWILPKRLEVAMIKASARQSIGEKRIRDVNPNAYLNAERKAGRLAFEAMTRKDYPTAYMYKRMQLVNHEMYRAATRAKERAQKTQKYLTKFESKRVQQRLGRSDVLEKILGVLEGVDFRKRSLTAIDRRKLETELARAIDEGELVMPPGVLDRVFDEAVNWQELTIDEFEAMRDLVKQLEKQAKAEVEAIVNGEKVDLERRAGEIAEQLFDNNKIIDVGVGDKTKRERGRRSLKQGVAAWLRPSSIARVLDGAGFGAITRNVIVPMRRAYSERLIPNLHKAQSDVSKIYRKYYNNEQLRLMHKKRVRVDAQNETYSHSDLLSLALNWGNEGNRAAVMGGLKRDGSPAFTDAGVKQMLANLTENDWAFVQEVWDYLETYWPEIRDAEKRRRGIAPKQVEASPFTIRTADGNEVALRGGYYPLRYAREHSDRVKMEEYEDYYKQMGNGVYVTANTRAGSTYERVKNHGRVVRLSLNVLDNHLREIVRDIAIGDEVNYLKRLLANKDVRNAFYRTDNEVALDTLNLWLTDAAVGELPAEGFWEGTTAWIRTGFTKAKLGWNLMTTALQFTGWTQSMAVIGSKNMAIGLGKFMRNPSAMWTDVMDRSKFLNTRYKVGAWDKDVQDTKAHLEAFFGPQPTQLKVSMNWLAHTYFLPIAKAQQVVDITTWLGAYEKGRNEQNLSEEQAVIFADTQVEAAQTSGFFSDRSGLERGTLGLRKNRQSQYIRIWTTLISYMLAKGNIAYEKTKNTNFRKPSEVLSYFTDLVLLYTVEGIASALLYGVMPEDDDTEDWAMWVATRTADSIVSGIPFVREIPSSRFSGGNTPIGAFAKDSYELAVQLGQGEPDEAMRKALYNVTGTAFHIPSSQFGRTLEAVWFEDDPEWWEYISGVKDR